HRQGPLAALPDGTRPRVRSCACLRVAGGPGAGGLHRGEVQLGQAPRILPGISGRGDLGDPARQHLAGLPRGRRHHHRGGAGRLLLHHRQRQGLGEEKAEGDPHASFGRLFRRNGIPRKNQAHGIHFRGLRYLAPQDQLNGHFPGFPELPGALPQGVPAYAHPSPVGNHRSHLAGRVAAARLPARAGTIRRAAGHILPSPGTSPAQPAGAAAMGSVRMSVPADLAADLARRGGIRIAIETGTWRGEGARLLSGIFDRVYSVELDPKVHAAARERHADLANVTFLQGNSPAVLRDLQRGIDEPVLFWLDAHDGWNYTPNVRKRLNPAQPPTPAGADSQCPLLDELQAVDSYAAAARSVILIDDARSFL